MTPVFDLHCDLLGFLALDPNAKPEDTHRIGCATPFLFEGNVRLQILALFALTEKNSTTVGLKQTAIYQELCAGPDYKHLAGVSKLEESLAKPMQQVLTLPAIENASNFAEEDEEIQDSLNRLDHIIQQIGNPLYITITHHLENRFGGGNSTEIGLKEDGRRLLDHLNGKGIAIDMSHTSDWLAEDILKYIDAGKLDLKIIASHSNFRTVWEQKRNLPDWLVQEIIQRKGLIGVNFVRDFIDPDNPNRLQEHIQYAFEQGAQDCIAFGGDFFPPDMLPPEHQHRAPFFHPAHENASKYASILADTPITQEQSEALAFKNFLNYLGG